MTDPCSVDNFVGYSNKRGMRRLTTQDEKLSAYRCCCNGNRYAPGEFPSGAVAGAFATFDDAMARHAPAGVVLAVIQPMESKCSVGAKGMISIRAKMCGTSSRGAKSVEAPASNCPFWLGVRKG